jgi:PilZ domain
LLEASGAPSGRFDPETFSERKYPVKEEHWWPARGRVKLNTQLSRRSSSPSVPIPPGAVHGTRRASGSRREATERVRVRGESFQTAGWTLNISRGGARLVLEEAVELGALYQMEIGFEPEPRQVKIIWAQDEADGQIVGVQFLDTEGSIPPPPVTDPPAKDGR